MTEILVYATQARAETARAALAQACRATSVSARLELYSTGSLYQRLGPRRAPPTPDLVWWFGPFAARAAALDGFLQTYQPPKVADGTAHDPDWKWTALEYSAIGVVGGGVTSWQDLASVPRLAVADAERSESGLSILLASLDRARQVDGDVERGWSWWQQRVGTGVLFAEDDAGAVGMVQSGAATHALTLAPDAQPISGLAPIPHAVGLAANSRNADAAREMLDWLTSAAAGAAVSLSPWQATSNGLGALLQAAPSLDIEWARQQYSAVRQRWAQAGYAPR